VKVIKLAAGFAVGYVLGSRAGRGAYEQIAANTRQLRERPAVRQAQEKAKAVLAGGADAATAKLHQTAADTAPETGTTVTGRQRPAPRKVAVPTPAEPAGGEPLS